MHLWRDLVFDVTDPKERAKYIAEFGDILPLTHEVDPLEHAELCSSFRAGTLGTDGFTWSVWARAYLNTSLTVTDDGAGKPHPDVDFTTLDESFDMMLQVAAHAERESLTASNLPSRPPPSKPKAAAKRRK